MEIREGTSYASNVELEGGPSDELIQQIPVPVGVSMEAYLR